MKSTTNQAKVDKLLFWGELGVVILTVSFFIGLNTGNMIIYSKTESE